MALEQSTRSRTRSAPCSGRRAVTIGLVNNMGDEALQVTERQFGGLIRACAGDIDVNLRLFALAQTPRSHKALEYINARYERLSSARNGELDGLIITGAEPRAARLSDEKYWDELTELIDWAKQRTKSTVFSCLAAHVAVLHLDGVERRPLPEKCAGVFAFTAEGNHPFAGEQDHTCFIPHSRYNDLMRSDLECAGYEILMSSAAHGVDRFTKSFGSEFVFLQGHLEYYANSLAREYRRDMGRWLRRETHVRPPRPKGYFSAEAEAELDALELRARADRLPVQELTKIDALAPSSAEWRDSAISFYRNWITKMADSTRRRAVDAERQATQPKRLPAVAYHEA